jgi:hypothetical protein
VERQRQREIEVRPTSYNEGRLLQSQPAANWESTLRKLQPVFDRYSLSNTADPSSPNNASARQSLHCSCHHLRHHDCQKHQLGHSDKGSQLSTIQSRIDQIQRENDKLRGELSSRIY